MTGSGSAALAVMLILLIKHFVCDYPLQSMWMVQNKGTYGHRAGIAHAAIHAAVTPVAFLVLTPPLFIGLAIMVGEFLVHYHIDVTKEQVLRRRHLTAADSQFWFALGLDQLLHQLTYVGIAAILLWASAPA